MDKMVHELKDDFSQLSQTMMSYSASIKQLDTQVGKIFVQLNARPRGGLLSNMIANPKNDAQVLAIVTRSGKVLDDPFRGDLNDNLLKNKAKEVMPQRKKANNEKDIEKSNEKVVEVRKPQGDARPTIQVPSSFPQRLYKKEDGEKLRNFMAKLCNQSINISLLKTIQEILGYAKLMKKLMSKKKLIKGETIKIKLDTPTPTSIRLLKADRSIKRPVGILFNVLVKVEKFILPEDFVVLDFEMDKEVPIILVRPFLSTRRAIVDLEKGDMKFRVQEDEGALDELEKGKVCNSALKTEQGKIS
ncbi:uncharacterized protein LOC107849168 [Capsicum annuum]|uniref:uncharacterized protein LOC107849168 n=1 Tax=Capsicum annuum TaxID=4072 RepID=UPI001FB0DC31|nr:uncharacterized protein LOC107849168 [Capsicum annuum]